MKIVVRTPNVVAANGPNRELCLIGVNAGPA